MNQSKDYQELSNRLVWVGELVVTNLKLNGNGKDDPYRNVRQVYTKDGELVAQYDLLDATEQSDER